MVCSQVEIQGLNKLGNFFKVHLNSVILNEIEKNFCFDVNDSVLMLIYGSKLHSKRRGFYQNKVNTSLAFSQRPDN